MLDFTFCIFAPVHKLLRRRCRSVSSIVEVSRLQRLTERKRPPSKDWPSFGAFVLELTVTGRKSDAFYGSMHPAHWRDPRLHCQRMGYPRIDCGFDSTRAHLRYPASLRSIRKRIDRLCRPSVWLFSWNAASDPVQDEDSRIDFMRPLLAVRSALSIMPRIALFSIYSSTNIVWRAALKPIGISGRGKHEYYRKIGPARQSVFP